jgi:hypothetical protein
MLLTSELFVRFCKSLDFSNPFGVKPSVPRPGAAGIRVSGQQRGLKMSIGKVDFVFCRWFKGAAT